MRDVMHLFLIKLRREPHFAVAVFTILVFTCPVLISILLRGFILLPSGYTSSLVVEPIYGFIAILINVVLLCIFGWAPFLKGNFHSIVTPDYWRKIVIYGYFTITFVSIYIINIKLDLFNSLLNDPVLTILKAGGDLGEENLLRYYFYGISGCIGFALVKKEDPILLRALSLLCMISIVLFYFSLGRREISVMTLCFLFLLKREKVSKLFLFVIGAFIAMMLLFILNLRAADDSGSMLSTNSEELSTVAYSAYVIQKTTPDLFHSVTEATVLRAYIIPGGISESFIKTDSGYTNPGAPVLGIAGITYMYGFIVPFLSVLIFGSIFRTVSSEFRKKRTPVIKLLLIYIVFRSFNLFRNGEFPIVTLDLIKFFLLISPAIFLKFKTKTVDGLLTQNIQRT